MRSFLTGGLGFVGGWLIRHLEEMGDEAYVLPLGIDITDVATVTKHVAAAEPDVIYHLAALAHVGDSWENPQETFRVNAIGTVALLEVARSLPKTPRVLLISSAEVYGAGDGAPMDELTELRPTTPYAASKVASEYIGLQAHLGRGLEVIRARPFNHIGPGQSDSFVVSGLARRIAEAERDQACEIRVGNLDAARDFTDVRDVVRAYRLLADLGQSGEVYNVCSGRSITIAELLQGLLALAKRPITAVTDEALFRPVDVPMLIGDCRALHDLTKWEPQIPPKETIADVLEDWRRRLAI